MKGSADKLLKLAPLRDQHADVLSLVGRAMFMRYLIDRSILDRRSAGSYGLSKDPRDCFSDAIAASKSCDWLDATFNGSMLPLWDCEYERGFRELERSSPEAFKQLSNILYHADHGQLTFEDQWKDLDFTQVPAGLLSEVYEDFAHTYFRREAKKSSVHYTPRYIAEFMVDQAFEGLRGMHLDEARVLDPAAGAGIFLVLALKRLVSERWERTQKRPGSEEIRSIMYSQIAGLDINEHATKLAALSLYLTVLELDPEEVEISKLKFKKPLVGSCLHVVSGSSREDRGYPEAGALLGSIDKENCPPGLEGSFDLVIGNPPWRAWSGVAGKHANESASRIIRHIASKRSDSLSEIAEGYDNPDNNPDLPFVWRAMEWGKPNAQIAFALNSRILFRQAFGGLPAREALFRNVKITGIVNASALRTCPRIWPKNTAPFCLLFAKNVLPERTSSFYFVNPYIESSLSKQGRFRIDFTNSEVVGNETVLEHRYALKTLFKGGSLDLAIIKSMYESAQCTVKEYWNALGLRVYHGNGYQDAGGKYESPKWMRSLKNLSRTTRTEQKFTLNHAALPTFAHERLTYPRRKQIYTGPLVLVPKSFAPDRERGEILFTDHDVVYSESYFGFSGGAGELAPDLTRYLYLIAYSKLFRYFVLMTSAKFGVEREIMFKEDIERFPLIPMAKLGKKAQKQVFRLAEEIRDGACPWGDVDSLVYSIYGLSRWDQTVVEDALKVSWPSTGAARTFETPANAQERREFLRELDSTLKDFFSLTDDSPQVKLIDNRWGSWRVIRIGSGCSGADGGMLDILRRLRRTASDVGATCAFYPSSERCLYVGLLDQRRFWTRTKARQVGLTIVRRFSDDVFPAVA
jgi:hypothetical protein